MRHYIIYTQARSPVLIYLVSSDIDWKHDIVKSFHLNPDSPGAI